MRSTGEPFTVDDQRIGRDYGFVIATPSIVQALMDGRIERRDGMTLKTLERRPDDSCDWPGCGRTGPVLNNYYMPRGADGLRPDSKRLSDLRGHGMICFCPKHDPWLTTEPRSVRPCEDVGERAPSLKAAYAILAKRRNTETLPLRDLETMAENLLETPLPKKTKPANRRRAHRAARLLVRGSRAENDPP